MTLAAIVSLVVRLCRLVGCRGKKKNWPLGSRTGERNGNPLQYSCQENPRNRGAWWDVVFGVAQSQTRLKRLSSSSSSRLYYGKENIPNNLLKGGESINSPLAELLHISFFFFLKDSKCFAKCKYASWTSEVFCIWLHYKDKYND